MRTTEEGDILSTKSLYNQLFNKNKLEHRVIEIQDFQQPLLVAALETDELLKSILKALYLVDYQAHLIEFKKALEHQKIASMPVLNDKVRLLELIGAVQIKNYYIKLTAQGVSYFKNKYYRANIKVLEKTKLEHYTKAKMKLIDIDKNIKATKVGSNIYRGARNKYAIVSDSKDTKEKYLAKIEKAINIIELDLLEFCAKKLVETSKKEITIDIAIYISEEIFAKYSIELLNLKENRFISYDYRADLDNCKAILNIKYLAIK